MFLADACKRLAIRMVAGQRILQTFNTASRFLRFLCLVARQIIQRTARVGFDVADGFVFQRQIGKHIRQNGVLVNIGQITGMKGVLIR